ncbi:MAG: hypothetical protein ABIJ84_01045 [bacterium]
MGGKRNRWGFDSPHSLHDKTFFSFLEIFAGGAKRRPVRFEGGIRFARRATARLAILQNEVRAENISASDLFRKKVAVVCDFLYVFSFFYPVLHRFEPANPLLFKTSDFFFQRLFLGK